MRVAVVGHVEWVTFAQVERVPTAGEIIHARKAMDLPAGGGPVAAMQLAKLAGSCTFFTALGSDDLGRRAKVELEALGLRVHATFRDEPQRRAFTFVDASGERTITVMGSRLGPRAEDPLPWKELERADAVFFCAGDDEALRLSRRARVLVATTREAERLAQVGVALDAAVGSGRDPAERYLPMDPPPRLIVTTAGAAGGWYRTDAGEEGTYPAAPLPGEIVDAYGCGDSFMAALAYGLGAGMDTRAALELAARCGAACITGLGPYSGQLETA